MVLKYYLIPLLLISFSTLGQCPIPASKSKFDMDDMGNVSIVYAEENNCFQFFYLDKDSNYFSIEGLKDIRNVSLDLSVELSFDGKFVLIGFNVGESSRVYQLYNSSSTKLIKEVFATYASWRGKESEIIFIPDYGVDEVQQKGGITLFNPANNLQTQMFNEYYFYGRFIATTKVIMAKVSKQKAETYSISLARLNLEGGDMSYIDTSN